MYMRKTIDVNEITDRMVEEIKSVTGEKTFTQVVLNAIFNYHRKIFPPHAKAGSTAGKTKYDEETEKVERVCTLPYPEGLNGKIVEDSTGRYCEYTTYNRTKENKQKIPLTSVKKELVDYQYTPSYQKVQAIIKKR